MNLNTRAQIKSAIQDYADNQDDYDIEKTIESIIELCASQPREDGNASCSECGAYFPDWSKRESDLRTCPVCGGRVTA